MIVVTTPSIEGKIISEYIGVLFSEVVIGSNFANDIAATITNVVGGRSLEYEEDIKNGRIVAMNQLIEKAKKVKADALVGLSYNIEIITNKNGSMMVITCSATAIRY